MNLATNVMHMGLNQKMYVERKKKREKNDKEKEQPKELQNIITSCRRTLPIGSPST